MLSPCYYHRFQGQNIFTLSRFIPVIKDLFPTSIFYIEIEFVCKVKALTSQWEHLTFYTHFQGLRLEWSRRIKINPKSYMFLKHVPGTRNIFAVSAEEPKHHQIVKILYPEKLNFTSCKEFKWRWNQFWAFSIVHL